MHGLFFAELLLKGLIAIPSVHVLFAELFFNIL